MLPCSAPPSDLGGNPLPRARRTTGAARGARHRDRWGRQAIAWCVWAAGRWFGAAGAAGAWAGILGQKFVVQCSARRCWDTAADPDRAQRLLSSLRTALQCHRSGPPAQRSTAAGLRQPSSTTDSTSAP